MNRNTISRRQFARLLGAGAALVAAKPALSLARSPAPKTAASELVRLGSNENSYGPSPKALQAITDSFQDACRYPYGHVDTLLEALAKREGVAPEQILLGAGSSEILMLCAAAFTGSGDRTLVLADPTFELIARPASFHGAEVVKVPLTSTYAHDLPKMAAAAKRGLVYICNPNNPTASLTPKSELREFIGTLPHEVAILVDEAYHDYVESDDYESVIPMIKDHPNLIVARTFSKIYGMAGVRCGYCIAQPETIKQLRPHQSPHTVSIPALAAAVASVKDREHVPKYRALNRKTRATVTADLDAMGYKSIPSEGNFVMVDLQQPVEPLIQAMRERKVVVGRLFPALPNHLRVTIAKESEMKAFLAAFREVMA
ncbi:MAG: histidinol-phosphate transaminase [Chthoniobacterales bacterium]|nr:histidinol-phosphate transaminase [Chthoniobacterales bacterium]